jgi:pimeloyl-ACP methyl ester carboxylesterase
VIAQVISGPSIAMTPTLGPKSVGATFEATGRARLAWRTVRGLLGLGMTHPSSLLSRTARITVRHTNPFDMARMFNRRSWQEDYRGFLEWFFGLVFVEPHSTKQIEDTVGWGLETTPEVLADTITGDFFMDGDTARQLCARVSCPSLVITGGDDIVTPPAWAAALAQALGREVLSFPGYGHSVPGRHPVAFNLAVRDFIDSEVGG